MSTTEVDHSVALDTVYHFLLRNGYTHTIRALQLESRRPYPVLVESDAAPSSGISVSRRGLEDAVMDGRWDVVLGTYLSTVVLHEEKVFAIFEHVLLEMLHVFDVEPAARTFFTHSPVFKSMKRHSPAQHARLTQEIEQYRPQVRTNHTVQITPSVIEKRRALLADINHLVSFVSPHELQARDKLPCLLALEKETVSVVPHVKRPRDVNEEHRDGAKELRVDPALTDGERASLRSPLPPIAGWWSDVKHWRSCDGETVTTCRTVAVPMTSGQPGTKLISFFGTTEGRIVSTQVNRGREDGSAMIAPEEGPPPSLFAALAATEVMSMDCDVSLPSSSVESTSDETLDAWLAVGFRSGVVRVYDIASAKLARKFDIVDALGVHDISFCGPVHPQLKQHRAMLAVLGLQGTLSLLSIAQGVVCHTLLSIHGGGVYVVGMARLTMSTVAAPEGILATCGEDNTIRFWTVDASQQRIAPRGEPLRIADLHHALSDGLDTSVIAVMGHVRCGQSAILSFGTRKGTMVVYSLERQAVILMAHLEREVTSMEVILCAGKRLAVGPIIEAKLIASTVDGVLHLFPLDPLKAFHRHTPLHNAASSSLAIPHLMGSSVEGLRLCSAWCISSDDAQQDEIRVAAISATSDLCVIL